MAKPRVWPTHAIWAREDSIQLAHSTTKLLSEADERIADAQGELLRGNPQGATLLLEVARRLQLQARVNQAEIQRILIQAGQNRPDLD
jgi:hypothetical protein